MAQAVLRIDWLPPRALDAANEFYEAWLDEALELIEGQVASLVLVLPAAPHDHADWRRAAVRDLARQAAPVRVNMVVGDAETAVEAALAYLERALGVTGQLLPLSGQGAGDPAR